MKLKITMKHDIAYDEDENGDNTKADANSVDIFSNMLLMLLIMLIIPRCR